MLVGLAEELDAGVCSLQLASTAPRKRIRSKAARLSRKVSSSAAPAVRNAQALSSRLARE